MSVIEIVKNIVIGLMVLLCVFLILRFSSVNSAMHSTIGALESQIDQLESDLSDARSESEALAISQGARATKPMCDLASHVGGGAADGHTQDGYSQEKDLESDQQNLTDDREDDYPRRGRNERSAAYDEDEIDDEAKQFAVSVLGEEANNYDEETLATELKALFMDQQSQNIHVRLEALDHLTYLDSVDEVMYQELVGQLLNEAQSNEAQAKTDETYFMLSTLNEIGAHPAGLQQLSSLMESDDQRVAGLAFKNVIDMVIEAEYIPEYKVQYANQLETARDQIATKILEDPALLKSIHF